MTRRKKKELKLKRDLELQHEAEHRRKSCLKKNAYNSEQEALSWGRFANDRYNQAVDWGAYFCQYCNKWHLTNLDKQVK